MKSTLRLAIGSALALSAANAMALAPADITAGGVVALYVSGATATDGVLENLAKLYSGGLCYPGTLDIYYQRSASNVALSRALTCRANFSGTGITAATSTTTGTKIAIFKESRGGSGNGIIGPARAGTATQVTYEYLDLLGTDGAGAGSNFATACATVSSTGATLGTTTSTFNVRNCGYSSGTASTVSVANRVPTAGISDVDPGTFVGTGGVVSSDASALTNKRSSVAVTFNPIVSLELFRALQDAQGLISTGGAEDTSSVNTMPSLPSSVVRGIFNGQSILSATEIYTNGVQLSARTSGVPSEDIYVCRRGDRSGTMTSFKVHFLNQGCTKATTVAFVSPDATGCEDIGCTWDNATYGAHYVFAGESSGDVRACMEYHSGLGRLAVGIASTENKPSSTNYRYIKVDGAAPTLKSVMDGSYSFFTQNTFNDKFSGSSAQRTIWDRAYSIIGNTTSLISLNNGWREAAAITGSGGGDADTGILDLPTSSSYPTFPVTGAGVRAKPVNGQLRSAVSGTPNNCNMPFMAYP